MIFDVDYRSYFLKVFLILNGLIGSCFYCIRYEMNRVYNKIE